MLLRKMKLHNFRQFKGEQNIEFATDAEKNVTIIMGENGSGKTTLAQAFTWCLYGDTDFDDKNVLNKSTQLEMEPNRSTTVKVELALTHAGRDYTMIRTQKYSTDSTGRLKQPHSTVFNIRYKKDGQQEFVKDTETEIRMKEILPKNLSKYFFFDGERIGNMSREISRGKSKEFADAVKGLLGLNAFTSALEHLGSRRVNSVVKGYDSEYDSNSDSKIDEYINAIDKYDSRLNEIDLSLTKIEEIEGKTEENISKLDREISENKDSEKYEKNRNSFENDLKKLKSDKSSNTEKVIKKFNRFGTSWMAKKLMKDSLQELVNADKVDKGIPDIHARTIEFLIERGMCICGESIECGNLAHKKLMDTLDYIPPQSIGNLIYTFVNDCKMKNNMAEDMFEELKGIFSELREFENSYISVQDEIEKIENKLEGMLNVGDLQKKRRQFQERKRELTNDRESLIEERGSINTKRGRCETEMTNLTLKDENNKRIATFKAYAIYMYDTLLKIYEEKESETREKLEMAVNEIFKEIYDGGFSLSIDDKYNIKIIVNDFDGYSDDIETSTAQSISVIFAFIAGVIKLARENNSEENQVLDTEVYPLVMDAPLSAFDKTRIKTICQALPKVAEQVIIFIKDTDGEIAETHLGTKVGVRYSFDKKNEFITGFVRR